MIRKNGKSSLSLFMSCFCIVFIHHQNTSISRAQEKNQTDSFAYMKSYEENEWYSIPSAPFNIGFFSGTIEKGIVIFGGFDNKQGAFLKDILGGRWEIIAEAPFTVHHCCGDNEYGPIVCGGDENRQIACMRHYGRNEWKTLAKAPFVVSGIAGDNQYGPIIVGGPNRLKVAYMRDYSVNKWHIVADAPFPVISVAGDNWKGIIVVGGKNNRQVAYMRDYTKNRWELIADAPFSVIDVTGSNHQGPIVLGGKDSRHVAYMNNYRENKWNVVAESPMTVSEIAGFNDSGILVCKINQKRRLITDGQSRMDVVGTTTREKVLKTAVVEFTERGDLGMQDAGAIIAEWLTTSLNKTGAFEVYERLSLSMLMEEHKLGTSGVMDEKSIAEIGRIRGVEAIITGSVSKLGDTFSVTAKVIDVETAKIITSSDIKVNDVNAIVSEIDELAWDLVKE
jgi:TolB-like protein